MTNWISVQDMLPKTYGLYLVVIKSEQKDFVTTFTFDTNERRWATPRSHQVTHWMPLPDLPNNEHK